jgi:excisionase family DNA binding protein
MTGALESVFGPHVLAAFDERARRIAEEVMRESQGAHRPAPRAAADLVDEKTRQAIAEQALIASKSYLTRAEAAKYLDVSERSIKEWAARPVDQNPFPEVRAGADPRYKRTSVDEWAEREAQRQRLKLAS